MSSVNYNLRLDSELKDRSFSVLEGYGFSPSQAIKLFLKQVAETGCVPLSFDYRQKTFLTPETQQALREAKEEFGTSKRYSSWEQVMEDASRN